EFVTFLPHLHYRLTTNPACIIARTMTQHGHQETQQPVPNIAYGLPMPLAFGPQSLIHAAEMKITLRGHPCHVIEGMAQAGVTPGPVSPPSGVSPPVSGRGHPPPGGAKFEGPFQ